MAAAPSVATRLERLERLEGILDGGCAREHQAREQRRAHAEHGQVFDGQPAAREPPAGDAACGHER
eukprot:5331570-Prymnesium_polylepis.1